MMTEEDPEAAARSLAEFYDSTDTAGEMADVALEVDLVADPMVTTSLRLPKSVLDRLRDTAAQQGVKPTALIRSLVESGISGSLSEDSAGSALRREAMLAARAVVEEARTAAEALVERVRRETADAHVQALADTALLAARIRADDRVGEAGEVVTRASAEAVAILAEARAEAARLRLEAEREVEVLAKRRDALADQLARVRELLTALARPGPGNRRAS